MNKMVNLWVNFSMILVFYIFCISGCLRSKITDYNLAYLEPSRASTLKSNLDKIHVENNFFVDNSGRVRLFHGINAVTKGPPWYPAWLLNETKLQYLKDWGFNVVRLGTMWSGVQPSENYTNTTYLNIISEIVTKLDKYGIYAILDLHQDVLSSYFGTYDGAPKWLIDKLPKPRHPFPSPLPRISFWAEGYIAQATGEAFQYIYNNINGTRDDLAKFWSTISQTYKNVTNVLGYELMNEPWCGDIYSNPSYLIPGNAGRLNLQPLYDAINDVIRENDDVTMIFYEPVTWGVVFKGVYSGTGLTHVPGGALYRNRSALSYHYYCWVLTSADAHQPYPLLKKAMCDRILGPHVFQTAIQDVKTLGGGSFLTEFGLCSPDGNNKSTTTLECEFVLNQADTHLQSWTYWDSKFFFGNGSVDYLTVRPFARPYARVIAGFPKTMTFDLQSAIFTVKFIPFRSKLETEIFVPLLHYPHGFRIVKSSGITTRFDDASRILYLIYDGNASIVKIVLEPK